MLENKILKLFGEPRKYLRILQLYQNKCPNYTQVKELKVWLKWDPKCAANVLPTCTIPRTTSLACSLLL